VLRRGHLAQEQAASPAIAQPLRAQHLDGKQVFGPAARKVDDALPTFAEPGEQRELTDPRRVNR
jgi:hypothetical protein